MESQAMRAILRGPAARMAGWTAAFGLMALPLGGVTGAFWTALAVLLIQGVTLTLHKFSPQATGQIRRLLAGGGGLSSRMDRLPAWLSRSLPLVLLATLSLAGLGMGPYALDVATNAGIYVLLALGLNVVVGMAGMLDLGYVGFYAVGAYTLDVLTSQHAHWPWAIAVVAAIAVSMFSGLLLGAPTLDPVGTTLEFTLDGEPWRLTGSFGDLRRTGLVRYRYDDARAGDYLAGWLEHLFLNAMEFSVATPRTTWHSRDGNYALRPVKDACEQLTALLGLYREGLHRPVHFFPKSAWRYMTKGQRISAAIGAWRSSGFNNHAEELDPAYGLALRGVDDPLDGEFVACATKVFQPLVDAVEDDRLPKASA